MKGTGFGESSDSVLSKAMLKVTHEVSQPDSSHSAAEALSHKVSQLALPHAIIRLLVWMMNIDKIRLLVTWHWHASGSFGLGVTGW